MIISLIQQIIQTEPSGEILVKTWMFAGIIIGLAIMIVWNYVLDNKIKNLKKENRRLRKETSKPGSD